VDQQPHYLFLIQESISQVPTHNIEQQTKQIEVHE
jgi:hypothetical protein